MFVLFLRISGKFQKNILKREKVCNKLLLLTKVLAKQKTIIHFPKVSKIDKNCEKNKFFCNLFWELEIYVGSSYFARHNCVMANYHTNFYQNNFNKFCAITSRCSLGKNI